VVGGDVGELRELRGREREVRATSFGERKARRGRSSERGGRRWHSDEIQRGGGVSSGESW
jgi:hypothetical protein